MRGSYHAQRDDMDKYARASRTVAPLLAAVRRNIELRTRFWWLRNTFDGRERHLRRWIRWFAAHDDMRFAR